MAVALGFTEGGSRLPAFVKGKTISKYLGRETRDKLENPVKFQGLSVGASTRTIPMVFGFDVTLLIDLCNAILKAEEAGELEGGRYTNIAKQARVIVNASAKLGIKLLAYAVAGYSPAEEEVIQAWRLFIQEEARKYEAEFPNELYAAWQRLYKIPLPLRGKPWQFMHLTRRHIYWPLAKSSGRILELLRALRAKEGDQKRYLFQFLNDIGARALRIHMGRVLEMAESTDDPKVYEAKFVERFGGQQELDLVLPAPVNA